MQQDHYYAFAVGAGFLLIGLVFYSYLRPKPEHRPSVTALLGLLGFALVASPNWTRISIRSDGLELSLLREIEGRQLRALGELRDHLQEDAAAAREPQAPPPRPAIPPRRDPAEGSEEPEVAPEEGPPERSGDEALAARLRARGQRLLAAYRRGELDLGELSDAELLALNEQLTERQSPGRRPPEP